MKEEKTKEPKKISLTTYILSLIIMVMIVVILVVVIFRQIDERKESNSNEEAQTTNTSNSTEVETNNGSIETANNEESGYDESAIIGVESTTTDWEKYPDNIVEALEKDETAQDYGIMPTDEDEESIWIKTAYSYLKNGYKDSTILKYYWEGDSTEIIKTESNYPQYDENSDGHTRYRYTDKIVYKIATFHEDFYATYSSNIENNEVNGKSSEIIYAEISNAYNSKIEETVKYQWNNLKNLDEYNGEKLSDKNYYYQIGKMVIMNGNNNREYTYKDNARAKKIKVTINGEKEYTFDLKDTNKAQEFDIDYKQNGVEKPVTIEIEVLERYNGEKTNDVYISDIQFGITSNIPQGR